MNSIVRNTRFDNLVNYESGFSSNSSHESVAFQSSADPNALSSLIKDNQLVVYSIVDAKDKVIQSTK